MTLLIQNIRTKLSAYIDVEYFVKFILVLIALFYFNLFFIAITDTKGRVYYPFLDHHFNYINWLRSSLLYFSNVISHLLGLNSYIEFPYRLRAETGAYVEAVYACLGVGLMSFWVAYITAHTASIKNKVVWCLAGILCIWTLNSVRISLLLIALKNRWEINRFMDHHTLFNICVYSLLLLLVYLYSKQNGKTANTSKN